MTPDTYKPAIDMAKVELLRVKMMISVTDMTTLLGITRHTYYGWVKGAEIRRKNAEKIRKVFRALLHLVQVYQWPTPEVISSGQRARSKKLFELIESAGLLPELDLKQEAESQPE